MRDPKPSDVQCPAGEMTRGKYSQNKADVLCRIAGNLRDAKGAICCNNYADCAIWRAMKDAEAKHKKVPVATHAHGDV